MILLQHFDKVSATEWVVMGSHHMPFDPTFGLGKSKEQLEAEGGVFIEEMPVASPPIGKRVDRFIFNPETKELRYEYVDIAPSHTDLARIEQLENKQAVMQTALDDLIMFGGGV